ncbi:MAG: ABC transporter substrate-binding protein [Myxococcota bacterium]
MVRTLVVLAVGGCSTQLVERRACQTDDECQQAFDQGAICLDDGYCSGGSVGPVVDGVSAEIVRTVGLVDVSGSLQDLGIGMRDGVSAALAAWNNENPDKRQFVHEVRDDRYDPEQSVSLADDLTVDAEDGQGRYAFAVLGSMGSPTSNAMLGLLNERQVPLFGTYSGATHLRRDPPDRIVWNTRASYRLEGETITRHLVSRDPNPIAGQNVFVFAQSPIDSPTDGQADAAPDAVGADQVALDAYGNSGYRGIVDVLTPLLGTQVDIPLATYRATSTNTSVAESFFFQWIAGLVKRTPGPQVDPEGLRVGIAMVPVASTATPFIREIIDGFEQLRAGEKPNSLTEAEWALVTEKRKAELMKAEVVFASISPVGDQLGSNLEAAGASTYCNRDYPIIVSQVVPFPTGGSTGALQFRSDLEAYDVNLTPGFVNFEGWIAGRVWASAVDATGEELTVDRLIDTLSDPDFEVDLGVGSIFRFSTNDHDGSDAVYGSVLSTSCQYEDFFFDGPRR